MAIRVDAHHHFWDTDKSDYYWMTEDQAAIRGSYGPEDLRPALAARGIDRTVLIQTIPSLLETEQFIAIAARTDFIAGVVGWVDLTDPNVEDVLAYIRGGRDGDLLVGVRHLVHDEPDAEWLGRPDVRRGIAAIVKADLTYDLLVRPRELPAALALVRSFPEAKFVVDHIAKPNIKHNEIEPWATLMRPLADFPRVWVKLSGMIEEAAWDRWRADDLAPYVQRVVDWFGPKRLVFGSNWPVCMLAAKYEQVYDALVLALGDISQANYDLIFGSNAVDAYRLDVATSGRDARMRQGGRPR